MDDSLGTSTPRSKKYINFKKTRNTIIPIKDSYFTEMAYRPKIIKIYTFTLIEQGYSMSRSVTTFADAFSYLGGIFTSLMYCSAAAYGFLIEPTTEYKLFYEFTKSIHKMKEKFDEDD